MAFCGRKRTMGRIVILLWDPLIVLLERQGTWKKADVRQFRNRHGSLGELLRFMRVEVSLDEGGGSPRTNFWKAEEPYTKSQGPRTLLFEIFEAPKANKIRSWG